MKTVLNIIKKFLIYTLKKIYSFLIYMSLTFITFAIVIGAFIANSKNESVLAKSANPTSLETNANDDSNSFNNDCCFNDYFYSMVSEFLLNKT